MSIHPPEPPSVVAEVASIAGIAGLSLIPFAGGALAEVVGRAAEWGYSKKRQAWMEQVSEELNRRHLQPNSLDVDSLADNPGFLATIAQATRAAVQTDNADKLEALRNAVVNATVRSDIAADERAILLDLVATLTGTHLQVLTVFADPLAAYARAGKPKPRHSMMSSRSEVVEDLLPDVAADKTLLDKVVADLNAQGLARIQLNTMLSADGMFNPAASPLGQRLIDFITLTDDSPAA